MNPNSLANLIHVNDRPDHREISRRGGLAAARKRAEQRAAVDAEKIRIRARVECRHEDIADLKKDLRGLTRSSKQLPQLQQLPRKK